MNLRAKSIVFLCVVGTLLYIVFTQQQLDQQRRDSVSAFSNTGKGMTLFYQFLKNLPEGKPQIYRRPLLYFEDLAQVDAVSISSPTRALSKKEGETLHNFLKRGGIVVLSAHDEDSLARLQPLLKEVDPMGRTLITKDENFENHKVFPIVSDIDDEIFSKNETYAFYSPVYFSNRASCADEKEVSCYYYSEEVGEGLLFLFLGLPPHSNGLLQEEFNRFFAFRLARLAPRVIFDEYHHFFPTKTLGELAKDFRFSLPLYGILLGVLLFFLFSRNPNEIYQEELYQTKGLHDVGENLLSQFVSQPSILLSARVKYRDYLLKRFPLNTQEINEVFEKSMAITENHEMRVKLNTRDFIELHKRLIHRKKGVNKNVVRKPDRQPDL